MRRTQTDRGTHETEDETGGEVWSKSGVRSPETENGIDFHFVYCDAILEFLSFSIFVSASLSGRVRVRVSRSFR